jgi:hypothetical protein
MSVTVDFGSTSIIRSGVATTYVLALYSEGSGATFFKIGRTKNLITRLGTLLSVFNSGNPRGLQGFPSELVGVCVPEAMGRGCNLGDDCIDKQYQLLVCAQIEGDIEGDLHHRFDHLRLGPDELHNKVRSGEWFWPCYPEDDDFDASIDAWLQMEVAA